MQSIISNPQSKVILLVEDNPDDVDFILRALKKHNVLNEVVVASDGVEALDYLFGKGKYAASGVRILPEIILLDLMLPKMNGLEVLQRLRADNRTKLLPVVIFTSSNEEQDIFNSYTLGANSYVQKPVDFTQFSEAIGQIGFYWLFLNKTPKKGGSA